MNISSRNPVTITGRSYYHYFKTNLVLTSFFEVLRFFWDTYTKHYTSFSIKTHPPVEDSFYVGDWYILKDSHGRIFNEQEIRKGLKDFHIKDKIVVFRRFTRRWHTSPICEYRRDPLPGSGWGNKSSRNIHRYPRVTAEKRDWDKLKLEVQETPDYVIHTRASRAPHLLPSSWDDIPRSNYRIKSWKAYRNHQYKAS